MVVCTAHAAVAKEKKPLIWRVVMARASVFTFFAIFGLIFLCVNLPFVGSLFSIHSLAGIPHVTKGDGS